MSVFSPQQVPIQTVGDGDWNAQRGSEPNTAHKGQTRCSSFCFANKRGTIIGCCYYCRDSEEQRVHVLKPHITAFFPLTKSVFNRCIRVRSWRLPDIQWIKLVELNVVGISADWAACVLACSILRRLPSTASALSACWPVPALNRRSPSSWAQRSKKLKASLFTVSPNDFKSICVCTSIILFRPVFLFLFL